MLLLLIIYISPYISINSVLSLSADLNWVNYSHWINYWTKCSPFSLHKLSVNSLNLKKYFCWLFHEELIWTYFSLWVTCEPFTSMRQEFTIPYALFMLPQIIFKKLFAQLQKNRSHNCTILSITYMKNTYLIFV